jgi:hypothetical protein
MVDALVVGWPVELMRLFRRETRGAVGWVRRGDIASVRLPLWGRVVEAEGLVPWLVVDPDGIPVEPVRHS